MRGLVSLRSAERRRPALGCGSLLRNFARFLHVALSADAGFAFPAAMEPPVLAGRAADEAFEVVGVPLGQQRHGAQFEIRVARIADRRGADFVVQCAGPAGGRS